MGITLGQIFWRRMSGESTVTGGGGITAHHFTVTTDAMSPVDFNLPAFIDAREKVIADEPSAWLHGQSMDALPGTSPPELKYVLGKALEEWT